MGSKTYRSTFAAATIMSALVFGVPALAEDENSPALAAAMKNVPTTLAEGLQAIAMLGRPTERTRDHDLFGKRASRYRQSLRSRMASCSSRSTR
jgi:hypothetical protein